MFVRSYILFHFSFPPSSQYDQMATIFAQFLAIYDNENYPYYETICPSSFKFLAQD